MKKSLLVIASLIASVTFLFSFMQPKESLYKNLKILPQDITKDDMDSVMKHFTTSLGVKCGFCHVRLDNEKKDWDFANDSLDHKKYARYMMDMTQDINKKYFEDDVKRLDIPYMNEVTCYSCHNGRKHPAKAPRPENPVQLSPLPPPVFSPEVKPVN